MPRPALIIEDDRVSAAVIRDWLEQLDFEVTVVERGDEALEAAARITPQLVVVDLVLPGAVDGAAIAAHLRLRTHGDPIGVVVISARSDAHPRELDAGSGASFLAKPFTQAELAAAITAALQPPPGLRASPISRLNPQPLPHSAVLGPAEPPAPAQGGDIGTEAFAEVLQRLREQAFSGTLTAETDGPPVRIMLRRGHPVAARASDTRSTFGRILVDFGFLDETDLAAHAAAGRRRGLPLGEVLLRARLIDHRAVELVLREQIVRRVISLARAPRGVWTATPDASLGLPGFDVHPAVVGWRLGDLGRAPLVEVEGYLELPAWVRSWWRLFDPDESLSHLQELLWAPAPAADLLHLGGDELASLVSHLSSHGLVRFRRAPPQPPEAGRSGTSFLAAFSDGVTARHRLWADASHYTVLGIDADADAEAMDAAAVSSLAAWHQEALPAGLDTTTRVRARELHARILDAYRVLGDQTRRKVYDARARGGDRGARSPGIPPDDAPVFLAERARQLLHSGNGVLAAGLAARANAGEGDDPTLWVLLSEARRLACPEDPACGEAELRQALRLDPTDEAALVAFGDRCRARGDHTEARRAYRGALRRNIAYEPARESLRALEESS